MNLPTLILIQVVFSFPNQVLNFQVSGQFYIDHQLSIYSQIHLMGSLKRICLLPVVCSNYNLSHNTQGIQIIRITTQSLQSLHNLT